ncbi:acyltransferase family protein [Flagellimonas olearia]|uniref:Acyltransferase family protein n=1 Tax=Flagellimonas olearia TaxID=552546 RepID=A0A6I1E3Q2_9FLAO|nr:acyltransferase [Allomuricauda olearia]KAB7530485.1 acyltransferase family protein [Allomuricauda olearia]
MIKKLRSFGWDWFERKSSQRYIPEIDALRFFAIIPVMLVHFSGALLSHNVSFDRALIDEGNAARHLLLHGNYGVHLFFAISGFILTLPFIKKQRSELRFKKYFIRRLVRIEPPYIIAITIFLVVHIFLGEQSITFLLERYLASFFYVHNIAFLDSSYILPVAWSLEIEVQFYVLMPLLLFIMKMFDTAYWRYFIYACLLLCSMYTDIFPFVDLNQYMRFFLAGIISADLYVNKAFKRKVFWDIVFVISLPLFFVYDNNWLRFFCLFGIVTSSLNAVYLRKLLSNRLVTIIGGMCYSLYLLHYPLYHLMMKIFTNKLTFFETFEMNYLFQGIIFVPLSIVMISLYFILVEKPFMVLSQKVGKPKEVSSSNETLTTSK